MIDWTKEREAAAWARCEAATKGEWKSEKQYVYITDEQEDLFLGGFDLIIKDFAHNAAFTAHARTDLPDAIRNGERLREALIGTWAHKDYECPCGVHRDSEMEVLRPASWQECTCGLKEALWGQEGEVT